MSTVSRSQTSSDAFFGPYAELLSTARESLPETYESALVHVSSAPLAQLASVTTQNLAYLTAGKEFKVNTLLNAVSVRGTYAELAMISVVSATYHLVLSIFYSAFVVLTIAQSEGINFNCRRHWRQITHGIEGVGIGLTGMVTPSVAGYLGLLEMRGFGRTLKGGYQNDIKLFESEFVEHIRSIFISYKSKLIHYAIERHGDIFYSEYDPFFEEVSQCVNTAQHIEDLQAVLSLVWKKINTEEGSDVMDSQPADPAHEQMEISKRDWSKLYLFLGQVADEAWKKLPDFTKRSFILLSSTALVQCSLATLNNLPYVAASDAFALGGVNHFLSSRFTYIESALISATSLVYSCAMAIFSSGLLLLTMGQSKSVYFLARKNVEHIIHSIAATFIGGVGGLLPSAGALLTYLLMRNNVDTVASGYAKDLRLFEEPLLESLKDIYFAHHSIIEKFGQEWFDTYHQAEFRPVLNFLDANIRKAKKMKSITKLVKEVWYRFPRLELKEKHV